MKRGVLTAVLVTAAVAVSRSTAATAAPMNIPSGKPDTVAPIVAAASNSGLVNRFIVLEFNVWDNSDLAAVHVWVQRDGKVLRRSYRGELKIGFYNWYFRPRAAGQYGWCIYAVDAAGNKSKTHCAPLMIFKHYPH